MKRSLNELVALIYSFYPQSILSNHPWYEASEEYRRLVAARRRAGEEGGAAWSALLDRLEARLPGCSTQNRSPHLAAGVLDAAYSAWLVLPASTYAPEETDHRLGFLVSFLVPYYVIYSARTVRLKPTTDGSRAHQEKPFMPPLDEHHGAVARAEPNEGGSAPGTSEPAAYHGPRTVVYVPGPPSEPPEPSSRRDVCFELVSEEQPYARAIVEEIDATFPGYAPMPPDIGQIIVPDVDANRNLVRTSTIYDCFFTDAW